MDLQNRIKNISEYFKGLDYVENLLIIKVQYKDRWSIFNSKDESIKVTPDDNVPNLFFYYGDNSLDYNLFFELIEQTIKHNLERENKVLLLKSKIEELKNIFIDEDIETLSTLKFTFKKKRGAKKIIKTEIVPIDIEETKEIKETAKESFENNNKVIDESPITIIKGDEIDNLY